MNLQTFDYIVEFELASCGLTGFYDATSVSHRPLYYKTPNNGANKYERPPSPPELDKDKRARVTGIAIKEK